MKARPPSPPLATTIGRVVVTQDLIVLLDEEDYTELLRRKYGRK